MAKYKEPPKGVAPTDFGIEWVNIITGHDHTNGNADGPYFCEVHLQINLENEDAFNRLNSLLSVRAAPGEALDAKLRQLQSVLIAELKRTRRDNESTIAIVNAIRLRDN